MAVVALGPKGEKLVSDNRLERVFYHLQKLVNFPTGLEFATQLQEPLEAGGNTQGRLAVFFITSPHPRYKAYKKNSVLGGPEQLISIAQMPYEKWQEADRTFRHYANMTDPIRSIFAGLLRRHLAKFHALDELNQTEVVNENG